MKWYLLPYYFLDEPRLDIYLFLRQRKQPEAPISWRKKGKEDVILIPGFGSTWFFMEKIGRKIYEQGYKVHAIKELGNNTKPSQDAALDVANYIQENKLKRVVLVTHSKGGVVAACVLKNQRIRSKVRKVISIACPYRGTILGGLFEETKELLPNSPLINNLHPEAFANRVINIYSKTDNRVIPNGNLVLKNALNIELDIYGHTRILESEEAIGEVIKALTD